MAIRMHSFYIANETRCVSAYFDITTKHDGVRCVTNCLINNFTFAITKLLLKNAAFNMNE